MSFFDPNNNVSFNSFSPGPEAAETQPNKLNWLSLGLSSVSALMSVMLLIFFVAPALNSSANKEAGEDLYAAPRDLAAVVEASRAATVTVSCGQWSGSGWGIDLGDNLEDSTDDPYPYEIVTNFHVIEDCVSGGAITIRLPGALEEIDAFLYNFDSSFSNATGETDLAILMTSTAVPTLSTTDLEPMPGDWLMAVGNPNSSAFDDMEGHVTFGRVSNFKRQYNVVVTDTALNHGNSGGPLVNSRGEVVGTNTWVDISEQAENIAYAIAIPKLCETLLDCKPGDPRLWGQ